MAWVKNINQVLTNDRDEDRLREIGVTWDRPDRQPMRLRWTRKNSPRIEWRDDLGHGVDIYGGIDKYIEKHIGKPFASTYSKFLFRSKYARYRDSNIGFYGYDSARRIFTSSFGARRSGYCIDSYGLIQPVTSKVRPKNRDIKLYLPVDQRGTEYSIDYQKIIQAQSILCEYFPEYHINKLIEHAGIWQPHTINIQSFLGCIDPRTEEDILKKIRALRSNRHCYIWSLGDWFIDQRLHYIDRIIKAGTREWYVEKCKLKRAQKYSRKHKHKNDTKIYDAVLVAKKHSRQQAQVL